MHTLNSNIFRRGLAWSGCSNFVRQTPEGRDLQPRGEVCWPGKKMSSNFRGLEDLAWLVSQRKRGNASGLYASNAKNKAGRIQEAKAATEASPLSIKFQEVERHATQKFLKRRRLSQGVRGLQVGGGMSCWNPPPHRTAWACLSPNDVWHHTPAGGWAGRRIPVSC